MLAKMNLKVRPRTSAHCITAINGTLFFISGGKTKASSADKKAFLYNVDYDKWYQINDMVRKRLSVLLNYIMSVHKYK